MRQDIGEKRQETLYSQETGGETRDVRQETSTFSKKGTVGVIFLNTALAQFLSGANRFR